jgi:hypothetical protein
VDRGVEALAPLVADEVAPLEALFVEPLPFHGMSAYPYGADEHYPDDDLHRAYRREWNTRPARQWVQSLALPRPRPAVRESSLPASLR